MFSYIDVSYLLLSIQQKVLSHAFAAPQESNRHTVIYADQVIVGSHTTARLYMHRQPLQSL